MASFVNILQDLLAMENSQQSVTMWTMIENQVHHLIHGSDTNKLTNKSPENIERLLTPDIDMTNTLQKKSSSKMCENPPKKLDQDHSEYENVFPTGMNLVLNDLNTPTRPKPSVSKNFHSLLRKKEKFEGRSVPGDSLKVSLTPRPKKCMRNFKWIRLDAQYVDSQPSCIWQKIENIPRLQPDYKYVEDVFCETHVFEPYEEVPLLSQTSRLDINLFLNRLDVEPEELVRNLIDGDQSSLSLPMLRYLGRVLPESEEVEMLRSYSGNLLGLGLAEQFLIQLSDIPNYRTLVAGHVTRAEFSSNIARLKATLTAMVGSCKFVLSSSDLREFLLLLLHVGNFLNHDSFNGGAAGYKLASLERVHDVKSSVLNKSLLHYLVEVAMDADHSSLKFLSELDNIEKAANYSPENIKTDVTRMNQQLKHFVHQLSTAHPTIQDIFHFFLEDVKRDFREMQVSICELRGLSQKMALYFCEDELDFDLQGCFTRLLTFFKLLKKCQQENSLFGKQHKLASKRSAEFKTKIRHKRLALEFGQEAKASSSMREDKKRIVDKILNDLHHGNFSPAVASLLSTPKAALVKQQKECSVPVKELKTPENELHPLDLSRISVAGTPMITRPKSEAFDDDFPNFSSRAPFKVVTSSENDLLEDETNIQQKVPKMNIFRRVSHHRSRSDLGESMCAQTKWVRYEEMKLKLDHGDVVHAPLAQPESCCTLAPLHLEDNGKFAYKNEMSIHEGPVVNVPKSKHNKKLEKTDKRTSIGNFFSKISRRVLKPRNGNTCHSTNGTDIGDDTHGKKTSQHRRFLSDDKENIGGGLSKNDVALEKRYAEREYRRFKARRQFGSLDNYS